MIFPISALLIGLGSVAESVVARPAAASAAAAGERRRRRLSPLARDRPLARAHVAAVLPAQRCGIPFKLEKCRLHVQISPGNLLYKY